MTEESPAAPLTFLSLRELIENRGRTTERDPYLEDARSDRVISYGELSAATTAWRDELDARSVAPGAVVFVDLADPLSFAVVFLAVVSSGRVAVPIDPGAAVTDVERIAAVVDTVAAVGAQVTDREQPAALGTAATLRVAHQTGIPDRAEESPGEESRSFPDRADSPGGVLLFTSGSTGAPKGVELSERQLLVVAHAIARHNRLSAADRGYNPLPLFHVNAEVVGLLSTLVAGAALVLDRRFRRTGFWELMVDRRVTWINAVPAILAVLARDEELRVPEGVRFIRSASAPLPDAVRDAFAGTPLVVSWGMTEGASQIAATPLGEPLRDGSVGPPVGGEVSVRDERGREVADGEVGSLWVRGTGIVRSYFGGRASDRFDADGWLSTGDLGRVDSDGWVYLSGRSDDVINRGGEKFYPAEVEDVLLEDLRIREAVVIGRPDAILGQVPVAYVIAASAAASDPSLATELAALCETRLPRFKRPVEIKVVDDVPRAATGKVQRRRVREFDAAREGATE
ncbi:AMP-binding protein [Glaciihabitans sp. INWT7]|uniref:AMP-binding protein n=1 Tax=Glaciihabitans sp. INWT7 TaxID=2596912 RepID=UPI001629C202|nr:AMP-binding protein [Glaciihabitans sp. INWT7]QNE46836.1 AMP-binding protein [Glaciihabitans sp. INWT7]